MEASENMALFGNAHGPVWLEAGMECVSSHWGISWEPFTKGLVLGGGRWHWWEIIHMEKQTFLYYLLFVIFILCFGRNQTPVLLIFYNTIPRSWTLLHSTWSTHAPDSDSHLSPPAGTWSVVITPGVAHGFLARRLTAYSTLNQYSFRATGKHTQV